MSSHSIALWLGRSESGLGVSGGGEKKRRRKREERTASSRRRALCEAGPQVEFSTEALPTLDVLEFLEADLAFSRHRNLTDRVHDHLLRRRRQERKVIIEARRDFGGFTQ